MTFTQATSLKQVYNFKGNFNAAVQGIMAAGGLSSLVERSNATLPQTRVEIGFELGEPVSQEARNGDVVYDYYQGNRLSLRICTERPLDQPSALPGVNTLHDEYCATAFALFEERLYPFTNYLPYYQVNMIKPRGTQSGLDGRFLEDWTLITFEVWFGIRPSAWPAGS